jgi:glycosyltransferase involved in cell wall biosynthesis
MRHSAPHRVLFFAGSHGDWGGSSRVLFTSLSLLDRTRFEPVVALPRKGPAEQLLAAMGIECVIWGPVTELRSPLAYLKAIVRALLWFRRHRIAIIDMNRANDWRPAEHVAAKLLRIPVVTHFHTVNLDRTPATRISTAIAAVSRFVAEHSATLGVPVHVIHNSVDIRKFAHGRNVRNEIGIGDDETLVTFAGQIRRIKGIDLFIRATAGIKHPKVRFLIVGACRKGLGIEDAYTEEELRALIAHDERILYAGYRTDMPDIYYSSDVVVAPSQWDEPFGLILIEAGAAGRPVVATCVGGIPEVVVDRETGFLVERDDVAALVARIQALVDDAGLRQRMGAAARARVEQHFTVTPVRQLEQLYGSLL